MDINSQQMELASYFGKALRENFGKGPESVYVTISYPYIIVYIRHFISPMERVLLEQGQDLTVKKTREILMNTLSPEIKANIKAVTGMDILQLYYDWNLPNKSGLFVGICGDLPNPAELLAEEYEGKEQLHKEIIDISEQAQKRPAEIFSHRLNPRNLVVIRNGILVAIEKELIRLGYDETLKVTKRNLEKRLLHNNNHFEAILGTKIVDIFVDWDLVRDSSVITFIMNPTE